MHEIANYKDLKAAVQAYLNRNDAKTVDNIPMFINFAEKMFTRMIKLPFYETNYDVKYDAVTLKHVPIPSDFLNLKHIWVDSGRGPVHLTRTDVETFTNLQERNAEGLNHPKWFTRVGAQIRIYPEPKDGETVHCIYFRDITEMRADADAPYHLIVSPEIMLYLSLRHASIFIRDNDQEQYWMTKASDAVTSLQTLLDDAEWTGSGLVVTQFNSL